MLYDCEFENLDWIYEPGMSDMLIYIANNYGIKRNSIHSINFMCQLIKCAFLFVSDWLIDNIKHLQSLWTHNAVR